MDLDKLELELRIDKRLPWIAINTRKYLTGKEWCISNKDGEIIAELMSEDTARWIAELANKALNEVIPK